MAELLTIESLFTLLMLFMLQAVLGFDNLLYITIESNKVGDEAKASKVRKWGIGLAVLLRIVLLVIIVKSFQYMSGVLFSIDWNKIIEAHFTLQSLVTLIGGGFIIYTAIKEISHKLIVDELGHGENKSRSTVFKAIALIVAMNLVFSFDSILSAMAIASEKTADGTTVYQVPLMVIAIIASGIAMILLADHVTDFLKKNRMYEVMGLFILFLVGVLLVTEGAHLAHLKIFGYEMLAMSKSSFYLVLAVLVITDIISVKYQKRLWAKREREILAKNKLAGEEAVKVYKETL